MGKLSQMGWVAPFRDPAIRTIRTFGGPGESNFAACPIPVAIFPGRRDSALQIPRRDHFTGSGSPRMR